MDSTARFLLGGALGAALGYLLSQKSLQKAALQGAQGTTAPAVAGPTPLLEAEPEAVVAPPEPVIEAEPAPVVDAPWTIAVAAPVLDVPVLEAPILQAPVLEAPIVELVEAPALEAPAVETPEVEAPAMETPGIESPAVEAPESDVPVLEAEVVEAPYAPAREPVMPGPFGDWESPSAWTFAPEPAPFIEAPPGAALGAGPLEVPTLEPSLDALGTAAIEPPFVEPIFAEPAAAVTEAPVTEVTPVELPSAEYLAAGDSLEVPVEDLPSVEEPLSASLEWEPSSAPSDGASIVQEPVAEPLYEEPAGATPLVEEPLESGLEWGPTPGPLMEAPAFEIPVVELPLGEPVAPEATEAGLETGEEAPQPRWPAEPYVPAAEEPESELILTRDFLDEPLSGAGWEPTAVPVLEEALEDLLPNVPDEFPPLAAAEIERPTIESRERWASGAWSETAVEMPAVAMPAVEMPEVEMPAGEGPGAELVVETPVAEVPAAEAVVETPTIEFDAGIPGIAQVEESLLEGPVVEEPYMEAVIEAPPAEASVVDVPLVDEPVVELAPAQAAPVDDLKARIEETRRRIRQELEQPFITPLEPEPAADDWTVSPAVAEDEVVDLGPDVDEVDDSAASLGGFTAEPELADEEPVDYEAMRSRIEVTRSRLKAKAFDAMMTGEASLLGRDTEDQKDKRRIVPAVDSEVEETIESSLREEED